MGRIRLGHTWYRGTVASGQDDINASFYKTSRKSKQKKQAEKISESGKTQANKEKVITFVSSGGEYSAAEIAEMLDLSPARTRAILKEMCDEGHIESTGGTKGRRYRMK